MIGKNRGQSNLFELPLLDGVYIDWASIESLPEIIITRAYSCARYYVHIRNPILEQHFEVLQLQAKCRVIQQLLATVFNILKSIMKAAAAWASH